jgi:dihydroneopterin aldolase
MPSPSVHPASLTAREALLFEAGIKLGGIFHQYLGVPVTRRTAPGLARTIERAVALQPFVARVRVRIDPARGGPLGRGRFAYHYLTAEMLDVRRRATRAPGGPALPSDERRGGGTGAAPAAVSARALVPFRDRDVE